MSQRDPDDLEEAPDEGSSVIAWFLTGAVIGVTAAMLFAPRSGRHTRQFLSEKTQRGKEAVTEGSQEMIDAGRDMFERGRKLVEDAADLFDRGRKLMRG
jgi:gas vesicle protein